MFGIKLEKKLDIEPILKALSQLSGEIDTIKVMVSRMDRRYYRNAGDNNGHSDENPQASELYHVERPQ